ncbi:YD repeat [unidentified eubacterium SCB49]|nr:YD repeat [unidentified eubacterium SCB49]
MVILYIFSFIFIISPFLPAIKHPHWFFRTADFIRLQSIAIQIILIILLFFFGNINNYLDWILAIALIGAALYQINKVYKYSSLFPRKKTNFTSNGMITLFAANVLQTNKEYDKLIAEIKEKDPDIVVTMESNKAWEKGISSIEKTYPYQLKAPNEAFYGMHVYSKRTFDNAEIKYQVENHVPSIFFDMNINETDAIHFCFLHPAPPSPTENETSIERDAELMLTAKTIRNLNKPIVVCGDMNDVVWSRTTRLFKKITGMIDPRIGRGFFSTYSAEYWFMRFPLDHLFHTKDLFIGKMERSKNFGSDHFAMYYEIQLKQKKKTPDTPIINQEDKKVVKDIINNIKDS